MAPTIYLALISKAGGVGKTTLNLNIAYEISLRNKKVCIIDLDSNHSLEEFAHLEPEEDISLTSWEIFSKDFTGEYSLKSIFGTPKIKVLQGHDCLETLPEYLYQRKRREDVLLNIFKKYPLNADVVIFDLPGGFDLVTENIMGVATHLLLPIEMGVKASSVTNLLERIELSQEELELDLPPKILGLLPNQYDNSLKSDIKVYQALKDAMDEWELTLYEPIRDWGYFKQAAYQGKALKQIRSTDPMAAILAKVVDDLLLIEKEKNA